MALAVKTDVAGIGGGLGGLAAAAGLHHRGYRVRVFGERVGAASRAGPCFASDDSIEVPRPNLNSFMLVHAPPQRLRHSCAPKQEQALA